MSGSCGQMSFHIQHCLHYPVIVSVVREARILSLLKTLRLNDGFDRNKSFLCNVEWNPQRVLPLLSLFVITASGLQDIQPPCYQPASSVVHLESRPKCNQAWLPTGPSFKRRTLVVRHLTQHYLSMQINGDTTDTNATKPNGINLDLNRSEERGERSSLGLAVQWGADSLLALQLRGGWGHGDSSFIIHNTTLFFRISLASRL